MIDLRFDSTPSADVLAATTSTPLCATPCAITIDPDDGGGVDTRVFTLHRDGFIDRTVSIALAAPPSDIRIVLARATGRSRPPRSTSHHAAPTTPTPPTPTPTPPTPQDTALMAPEPPAAEPMKPEPTATPHDKPKAAGKGKGKVDATETLDPFHH